MTDTNSYRDRPETLKALNNMHSLEVVESIIDGILLENVAQHAYNKYLTPKVIPFCAISTVATMGDQMMVSTVAFKLLTLFNLIMLDLRHEKRQRRKRNQETLPRKHHMERWRGACK